MPLTSFHPAVAGWFRDRFPAPTDCQVQAWTAIREGHHALIAAPTGSGKTLAAFLAALDDLARSAERGELTETTRVLYISPLKALSNDIQKNLEVPLDGINRRLFERGHGGVALRAMVRTGDTPAVVRAAMLKHPPHILVTTPESTYLLLTSEGGRRLLKTVRTVIVDEIHALLGSKRGAHLALSLERLERLTESRLNRIGLSATQKPIEEVARFLTGGGECRIVDTGHLRRLDLGLELPDTPLEAVLSGEAAKSIYDRMAELIGQHRTTLVFVNTRRAAERIARALSERLGEGNVTSHHGSLAREQRLDAENRLKQGTLKALVATASLELGIDVGEVDLVCQLGSPGAIATFLQRVGRSGHFQGGVPKGRLFPTSRDDLIECLALLDAVRRAELDVLRIPPQPLDVLAQQIVAMVACEDFPEDELYQTVRRAWLYRNLDRKTFDDVVHMLAEGYHTRRGQRAAYLRRDAIHRVLRARRGARLTALTCGGAIPDNAEYRVILEPAGEFIGTVDEDFAIESMAGDIFQLGNASWRVLRLEAGTLRVEDAQGLPPSIPFWFGEAPGRTHELSFAVSRLRVEIVEHLANTSAFHRPLGGDSSAPANLVGEAKRSVPELNGPPQVARYVSHSSPSSGASRHLLPEVEGNKVRPLAASSWVGCEGKVARWLQTTLGVSEAAAVQAVNYLAAAYATLGAMPSFDTVVFERFFDESGGMQFIIHAPFGSRLNRAWGLALRKRFCRGFNFELQAAATENAVILSLSGVHSFPLEDVTRYLNSKTVRDLLIQALLAAPMFTVRWRWNAVCALALKRFQGGRKTPPYLLRMQAEDLVASVFPDQIACFENIVGDRRIPDHPLVHQTIEDCLTEAMDIDRLITVIQGLETGAIRVVTRDLVEPSPLAAEIVNSRVYSFLDGAPLEERRTRAVASRRWLDPAQAGDLGRLDENAIARVREEAWPEVRDAEELHDALLVAGCLVAPHETRRWSVWFEQLVEQGRAALLCVPVPERRAGEGVVSSRKDSLGLAHPSDGAELWLAAERWPQLRVLYPELTPKPCLNLPPELDGQTWEPEAALVEILRARLGVLGPVEAGRLALDLGLPGAAIEQALLKLESEGTVLRGQFTPGGSDLEWCDRGLLARIHRYTLKRLREEVEPVTSAEFMRFLFRWQHLTPDRRGEGPNALAAILDQLEGYESAAVAWESELLPARLAGYDPAWLDGLCLSGRYVWLRLTPATSLAPVKSSPITLLPRRHMTLWQGLSEQPAPDLTSAGSRVQDILELRGASFFEELVDRAGLLPTSLETALAELVAKGLAHSDSFKGLRALLVPEDKKHRYRGINPFGIEEAGRWARISPPATLDPIDRAAVVEHVAGVLLRRYGVMFRALLTRESTAPPWLELLSVYRRWEARGEIRGGRFVAGHYGEQFALPEAVSVLRAMRKQTEENDIQVVSACDPLNLCGIITSGPKLPALPGNRLLFQDGKPLALLNGKDFRWLEKPVASAEWELKNRLIRRPAPPQLRAYL